MNKNVRMNKHFYFIVSYYIMYFSYIPQKCVEKQPIYDPYPKCIKCGSNESYPIMNMVGSSRKCMQCAYVYNHEIIGYREVIVEKNVS